MQEDFITTQKNAYNKIRAYSPSGIKQAEFDSILRKAETDWPDNFEMQLDQLESQIASLKRLKGY